MSWVTAYHSLCYCDLTQLLLNFGFFYCYIWVEFTVTIHATDRWQLRYDVNYTSYDNGHSYICFEFLYIWRTYSFALLYGSTTAKIFQNHKINRYRFGAIHFMSFIPWNEHDDLTYTPLFHFAYMRKFGHY